MLWDGELFDCLLVRGDDGCAPVTTWFGGVPISNKIKNMRREFSDFFMSVLSRECLANFISWDKKGKSRGEM